jgi:hypothetical protein
LLCNQNIYIMKTKIALALLFGGVVATEVAAQNKLKVNYKEHLHEYALVRDSVSFEDLSEMVIDLLAPVQHWRSIESRVNSNYQMEFTYLWDSTTYSKSYGQLPKKIEMSAAGFSVYGEDNTLLDSDAFDEDHEESQDLIAAFISDFGYHPGLPDFPRFSYDQLLNFASDGFTIDSSVANQLTLIDPLGKQTTYDYSQTYVFEVYEDESKRLENLQFYDFQEGIGFLPSRDIKYLIDKTLDSNVTFVEERYYYDYQIFDYTGILSTTNTIQNEHIRLYPVPIQENLNVELINMPNDVIRSITVRDFQGNPVLTIPGNDGTHQVIQSNSFPSGLMHIEVTTNGGLYTRQSFKN